MADQTRNAWLYDRDGRAIIHVNMPAKDEDIPAIGARGRMDHVAFDCRDPDAMVERLTDLGIAYRRRETRFTGLTQIVLKGPNRLKPELASRTQHYPSPPLSPAQYTPFPLLPDNRDPPPPTTT